MFRQRAIFTLTHFYPLFLALHLYFGDHCRRCQVMYNVMPLVVFGGLFIIWRETSHIKLNKYEKFCIGYFITNLIFIHCFYCLCVLSHAEWIYNANWQVALFISVPVLFYIFNYRDI